MYLVNSNAGRLVLCIFWHPLYILSKNTTVGERESPKICVLLLSSNLPKILSGYFKTKDTFYHVFLGCFTKTKNYPKNQWISKGIYSLQQNQTCCTTEVNTVPLPTTHKSKTSPAPLFPSLTSFFLHCSLYGLTLQRHLKAGKIQDAFHTREETTHWWNGEMFRECSSSQHPATISSSIYISSR